MSLTYDPAALAEVPQNQLARAKKKIEWLWHNRAHVRHERLRHELNPFLKIRTGDLRIIYTFDADSDDMKIRVVGMRDDIYERVATNSE